MIRISLSRRREALIISSVDIAWSWSSSKLLSSAIGVAIVDRDCVCMGFRAELGEKESICVGLYSRKALYSLLFGCQYLQSSSPRKILLHGPSQCCWYWPIIGPVPFRPARKQKSLGQIFKKWIKDKYHYLKQEIALESKFFSPGGTPI